MHNLVIPATARTPAIDLGFGNNHLKVSGESYPEDVTEFYKPVFSAPLFVADPTIGPVLAAETVFEHVLAVLELTRNFALDTLKILGMYPLAPEICVLKIFAWGVAE